MIGRAVLVAGALLLPARRVEYVHATLLSTEPAAGSALAAPPHRIRLLFNEPIEPALSQMTLFQSDRGTRTLRVSADPHDVRAVVAPLDSLPAGSYRVAWRVVSADGHPVGGDFAFTIGAAAPGPTTSAPVPAPPVSASSEGSAGIGPIVAGAPMLAAILRGTAVGCLMALGGLLLFGVWGWGGREQRVGHLIIALSIITPIVLGAHGLVWLADTAPEHQVDAEWIQSALTTRAGQAEAIRTALAVLALWAIAIPGRVRLGLVCVLGALLVSSAIGHAAAMHPWWAIPLKALHLVAAAVWLGGLLWLILGERGGAPGTYLAHTQRISRLALAAVVLILITGTVEALLFVPSPLALLRSAYGALVIAKLAGLGVLVAFGAYHRFRLLPRLQAGLGASDFQRSVAREVGIMVFVVLLGGWLAYVPPPSTPHAVAMTLLNLGEPR
jgi:copper transport protein